MPLFPGIFRSQFFRKKKIPHFYMLDIACRIVDIIVCNDDLSVDLIQLVECAELSFVGSIVRHAVCDLNVIFFPSFFAQKIDFPAVFVEDLQLAVAVEQFVEDDIFKIMGQIIAVALASYRIKGDIFIIYLHIKRKFTFRFGRILFNTFNNISFFKIAQVLHYSIDRA